MGKAGRVASAILLDALMETTVAGGADHAKPSRVDDQAVDVSSRLSGQGQNIRLMGIGVVPNGLGVSSDISASVRIKPQRGPDCRRSSVSRAKRMGRKAFCRPKGQWNLCFGTSLWILAAP